MERIGQRSLTLSARGEGKKAVIVEGGDERLQAPAGVTLVQLAPACLCCVGELPLRVALARRLRQRPSAIWVEVSSLVHREQLLQRLEQGSLGLHAHFAWLESDQN
jgi:G3E family GTPase